jgi:hypothetical protein
MEHENCNDARCFVLGIDVYTYRTIYPQLHATLVAGLLVSHTDGVLT